MSRLIRTKNAKLADTVERVYKIIRSKSGKVRTLDLHEWVGDKDNVRYAITKLTVAGKIRRQRGLGQNGVEYFYHDTTKTHSTPHQ
jgi:hypothetical protein